MRKRKKTLVFGIVLLLLFLGIGYAYLTTTLSINGVTDVDANNWDVYFDNVNVTTGSVTGEQEIEAPTITSDTTVEFHVRLKEPGEFYEFTIEARNDGTIDAMIASITKKVNNDTIIPDYLYYSVTYSDGIEILNNHLLAHESLETYKVRVKYRDNIDPEDLPSTAQSLTLSFGIEHVQADENAKEVVHGTAYSIDLTYIGKPKPDGTIWYSSPSDVLAEIDNNPFYLKHTILNGMVTDSYVEFIITQEMANANPGMTAGTYYLRGGGATYNSSAGVYNNDSPYYDSNKAILLSAFGEENCEDEFIFEEHHDQTCHAGILHVAAGKDGVVSVNSNPWTCSIGNNSSYCSDFNI